MRISVAVVTEAGHLCMIVREVLTAVDAALARHHHATPTSAARAHRATIMTIAASAGPPIKTTEQHSNLFCNPTRKRGTHPRLRLPTASGAL